MTVWNMIQEQAHVDTLAILAREGVELVTDQRPAEYFYCSTTGAGPFKRIGRIVDDNRHTRIFVHGNVTTDELAYLTTALERLNLCRWNNPQVVDCHWYPNGEPYKRALVCRPLTDEDMSKEAFEMVDLTANAEDTVLA